MHARAVDAIPPGCDHAPAFVLLHGVGHGADANCHVGIGAVPAFQYRQVLIATADRSQARRVRERPKLTATSLEIGRRRHPLRRRRSGWGASIKMTMPAMTRLSERPSLSLVGPSHPADCPGGSTGSSRPSASLRANRAPLRGGALLWTTWTIRYRGQSRACRFTCRQKSADFDRRSQTDLMRRPTRPGHIGISPKARISVIIRKTSPR